MADYERMYKIAYNTLTDAERLVNKAAVLIQEAQKLCEQIYINTGKDGCEDGALPVLPD